MSIVMSKLSRRVIVAAASLSLGVGALCTLSVRADDEKMGGEKMMMPMTAEDQKACADQMAKMKEMAANPQEAQKMTMHMASMMVMDHMAKMMAMDPEFQKQSMQAMMDPNIKKAHDDAKMMAEDPEQMKKFQAEIMADPEKMKMVMHHAMMMAMKMDDKMGDMKDKMGDMKGKMMDKQ